MTGLVAALANIIKLAPVLSIVLALAGGGIGSGAVVWGVKDFLFSTFERPAIERKAKAEQLAADEADFEAAATKARQDREKAVAAAVDKLSTDFAQQQQQAEQWQQAQVADLMDEIAQYQNQLKEGMGHACPLDSVGVDFIVGVHTKPAPH